MHPLLPDLTVLKDEELHKKIHELTQHLTQSYRFGHYELAAQVHQLLDDYQEESTRRHKKYLEELQSKNNKFNDMLGVINELKQEIYDLQQRLDVYEMTSGEN